VQAYWRRYLSLIYYQVRATVRVKVRVRVRVRVRIRVRVRVGVRATLPLAHLLPGAA
jgi:hypothetical protein